MQIVTVNLPSIYIDAIAKLTEQGLFPSRSEAIRVALRDFLKSELGMVEGLLDLNENEGKVTVIQEPKVPAMKKIDMRSIRAGWT
ncbi:MAG: ribbon-helix-helix protein, CopG family [Candidatus Lokiarchaeota archaeon]|nr:ribbon-helix-helix protein, CopG family [Candidatus Lokiarchaeota archaeon]